LLSHGQSGSVLALRWIGFPVNEAKHLPLAPLCHVFSVMMFINHPTWTTADLPFGGIKNSGYGRELSSSGIQEFMNKKLVRVASIDAPARYSLEKRKQSVLLRLTCSAKAGSESDRYMAAFIPHALDPLRIAAIMIHLPKLTPLRCGSG